MQQQEFYSSCIKINGIPLLSPLMTDSIKEEMRRYKSLAVKVEEKLESRQLVKRNIKDKYVQANIIESINKLKSIKYDSDSDLSNRDTMSDTNNSDSLSKTTIIEPIATTQVIEETKDKHNIQSTTSGIQHSQFQVCSIDNIDTKTVTAKTDQNDYINATEMSIPNEDVSSENWKPQVPKTLNIVPITLSNEEDNISSPVVASKENENPPKLSRQGSYVLDTPSPILLAHMHTEVIDKDYVPTPTINTSQRKQWNIVQPKVKWENKQLTESTNQASNKLECATDESTFQHTEFDTLSEPYQIDQSVTKTEVAEEHTCKIDTAPIKNDIHDISLAKQSSLEKLEKDNNTCASNLSNEKSVEDTNSLKSQLSSIDENKYHDKIRDIKEHPKVVKIKSSITSEKLLAVYKEIEEMYKKQMMELIYRQQKEQSLLQAEFQKQQRLLLSEIQKCSFKVPNQTNASSNITPNQSSINRKERLGNIISETGQKSNINSPSNVRAEEHYSSKSSPAKHTNVIVCPLDYISSKNLYLVKHYKPPLFIRDSSPATPDFDFTREVNLCNTTYNNNNNYDDDDDDDDNDDSDNRIVYKNLNVNRQLFPLDSNTTHVPVLDTSVYHNKHILAVNTINAYTRGYLVRRLMRTERVITLKKVYKEALQCMLKLHVDAPLNSAEVDFLHRLQLQCDAASMNIVDLFAQSPTKRMKAIAQDREIKQSRTDRPTSSRSYSFATQKTLGRRNLKEFESTMTKYQKPLVVKKNIIRSRCQTWTSDMRDKLMSPNTLHQGIRRSTSAGTVRKPWR